MSLRSGRHNVFLRADVCFNSEMAHRPEADSRELLPPSEAIDENKPAMRNSGSGDNHGKLGIHA
jgi:hypothetical protein